MRSANICKKKLAHCDYGEVKIVKSLQTYECLK